MKLNLKHRRLRIVGKPSDARGIAVSVYDTDTGLQVPGIKRIVLTLGDHEKVNQAEVTYYLMQEDGSIMSDGKDGALEETATVHDSELDVTVHVSGEHDEA